MHIGLVMEETSKEEFHKFISEMDILISKQNRVRRRFKFVRIFMAIMSIVGLISTRFLYDFFAQYYPPAPNGFQPYSWVYGMMWVILLLVALDLGSITFTVGSKEKTIYGLYKLSYSTKDSDESDPWKYLSYARDITVFMDAEHKKAVIASFGKETYDILSKIIDNLYEYWRNDSNTTEIPPPLISFFIENSHLLYQDNISENFKDELHDLDFKLESLGWYTIIPKPTYSFRDRLTIIHKKYRYVIYLTDSVLLFSIIAILLYSLFPDQLLIILLAFVGWNLAVIIGWFLKRKK